MNPFKPEYFNENELKDVGFKVIGKNVKIAKNCSIMDPQNIEIGNNVRIDGYCTAIATGDGLLKIGSYVHIGGYSLLIAGSGITLDDFSGLSQGVRIYSRTDDYSGNYLTNPTVPEKYTGVKQGAVTLRRHVIVGSSSVILPGVIIGEGASIGALSLVTKNLDEWGVFVGCPVKRIKDRSKQLLELEARLKNEIGLKSGNEK